MRKGEKTFLWKVINICLLNFRTRPPSEIGRAQSKIPWSKEPGRLQSMGSLSWVRLSDFTFTFDFHALEKEMATHSSILAWRIPGTEEPSGLPSVGSHRVGHDGRDLAAAAVN